MAGKLGPQFALKGFVKKEWGREACLKDWQFLLQVDESSTLILESYSEVFLQELMALGDLSSPWIFCAQILKEDSEQLFAFKTPLERAFFEELRELNSVGPKTAALIVGRLGLESLYRLFKGDSLKSYKVVGVGPKTLEKIIRQICEQSKKFTPLFHLMEGANELSSSKGGAYSSAPKLLITGLEQLGMRSSEAQNIYQDLCEEDHSVAQKDIADLVRLCLKRWGQLKSGVNPEGRR